MAEIFGFDAYAPKEIADKVEAVGVAKTRLPLVSQFALGLLAGGFNGLGALFYPGHQRCRIKLRFQPLARRTDVFPRFDSGCRRRRRAFHRQQSFSNGLGKPAYYNGGTAAELDGHLSGQSRRRSRIGAAGLFLEPLADEWQCGRNSRSENRYRKRGDAVLGRISQRHSVQHFGLLGRLACARRAAASSTKSAPSSFRSQPSSPPALSTASPTCTSSHWEFYSKTKSRSAAPCCRIRVSFFIYQRGNVAAQSD